MAGPSELPNDWTRVAGEALADMRHGETECLEWCPICRAADLLRANASPELREQWSSVQREALVTIRALIDHYLERIDPDPPERGPRVQDIPIE
jgi:hypothetical protein